MRGLENCGVEREVKIPPGGGIFWWRVDAAVVDGAGEGN